MKKVDRYEIIKKIGAGGMGIVYMAYDPVIDRTVALKTLCSDIFESEEYILRFQREARTAGRLSHPNIVTVYDMGEDKNLRFIYIIMEYVGGRNLKEVIYGNRPPDMETRIKILSQIADGIDFAHSNNIIHRDLKPSNIIIKPDNSAKIADFGLAKGDGHDITRSGVSVGTPLYMAPEQLLGKNISHKCDLFSFGALAYELLLRKKAFEGSSIEKIMKAGLKFNGPDPLSNNINFQQVIRRSLSKNPEDRYGSASEFVCHLKATVLDPKLKEENILNTIVIKSNDHDEATETVHPNESIVKAGPAKKRYSKIIVFAILLFLSGIIYLIFNNIKSENDTTSKNPGAKTSIAPGTYKEYIVEGIRFAVVYCPPGTYMRGSPLTEDSPDGRRERQHRVTISEGFWIMDTPVTQELYKAIKGNNPSHFRGWSKPVETITWYDAVRFCEQLSDLTGETWTLPTEAQWEYACRAGTSGPFYFGDQLSLLTDYAWFTENSEGGTKPVGNKYPNRWGIYDMHGNVWEWCYDWFGYYPGHHVIDPKGPERGQSKVIRGGSWNNNSIALRSAARNPLPPERKLNIIGFRAVLSE